MPRYYRATARYYRGERGCKKLHPRLPPLEQRCQTRARGTTALMSGTTVGAYGTTVPEPGTTAGSCGSTAQKSSTTASLRRARLRPSFRRDKVRRRNTPRSSRKGGAKGNVYVRFHPNLSKADPLLIVRLSYDSTPPNRTVEKRRLQ